MRLSIILYGVFFFLPFVFLLKLPLHILSYFALELFICFLIISCPVSSTHILNTIFCLPYVLQILYIKSICLSLFLCFISLINIFVHSDSSNLSIIFLWLPDFPFYFTRLSPPKIIKNGFLNF